ncbi:MBL fold metallo-hydrolase [Candidatus Micrarchaeota archaeon]|nr:MBL fold metallo-hydrolase [Candidatus Micrarchaeota archaeon]
MEITFLGTRGWYPKKGQTACVLVETRGGNYLLDAGTGIYWLDEYANFRKPTCVLLSHFHLDHILGITAFQKIIKGKELTIYGEKGVKKAVDRIMRKPIYPYYFDSPLFNVKVGFKELKREQRIFDSVVKTAHLEHADPVLGIRIENGGRSFVYATDTLPCKATVQLARNCDVLVHETYFSDEDLKGVKINTGHSSPKGAARIAKEAGAKGLFLFHFNPEYDDKTISGMVEAAKGIFKNTFASKEFMRVKL